MSVATGASAAPQAEVVADRWTRYSLMVLAICILGWAFDIYEATITQLVTPILIKEWGITPATIGFATSMSRWIGLVGTFVVPVLADSYGRKPALIWSILAYSVFTGLTGFANGWISLMIYSSLTRVALAGESPVGMVMVSETAPARWRATALGGLVGGYPFGYMLCSLAALVVVPMWGWRAMYYLGVLPALMVVWIAFSIKESPRYERVSAEMLRQGLKKQLDIFAPCRLYPREMLIASMIYFFYLFTWIGWSVWMPFYLSSERHLGFQTMGRFLTIWMLVAIFAYWICGWLCDQFGRRIVIPMFCVPGGILLFAMGYLHDADSLFWAGLITNSLLTGSFGAGLGYTAEIFPTQIRGAGVGASFTFGSGLAAFAPLIIGWIATAHSVAAGLPLLALSFILIAPIFLWFTPDTTRRTLTDFVGEKM
jgi:MFS family permease